MPKIEQKTFLDLTAYRQKNGLLQKDIAIYLNVTRGYISMVEKGTSKLSHENIDKLIAAKETKHWDYSPLIPAFTRLELALDYLNIERNNQRKECGLPPSIFSVPQDIYDMVKYGEIGIPESIADMWGSSCPELNKDWLLTGNGEMIIAESPKELSEIELLRAEISQLNNKIELYKDEIAGLLQAALEKTLNAINQK